MEHTEKELKEIWQRSFDVRLERLMKFNQLRAPDFVTCMAIVMLVKAAILLYGHTFWQAVHDGIVGWFSIGMGVCPYCKGDYRVWDVCPACIAKAAADDDEGEESDERSHGVDS